ncbi:UNVERIFIED_CONTAM: F-box protein FBW2 [Sesamum latifolium]|uniref:F-box protein FBW2 n=1 Tax=Sesamum latifolium TaxID=2727402 RepID=A0AAW2Y6C1_9LAMI
MDEGSDFPKWDELIPDALGLIFKNLSLLEVLTVVPRVCKSWRGAVMGPYCWQEIDIEEWCTNRKPEIVDQMLRLLIPRSCGSLRKLSFSGLAGDEIIFFIANHAKSLQTLRMPRSKINDSVMERGCRDAIHYQFLRCELLYQYRSSRP